MEKGNLGGADSLVLDRRLNERAPLVVALGRHVRTLDGGSPLFRLCMVPAKNGGTPLRSPCKSLILQP